MNHPKLPGLWEILIRPSLWQRNYSADPDFDVWLSAALDRGEPISLNLSPMGGAVYEVQIAGMEVWIQNAPYADVTVRTIGGKAAASRRVALRFRRAVAPLIRQHSRFHPFNVQGASMKEIPSTVVPLVGVSGIDPKPGRWYYPTYLDGDLVSVHELSGSIVDWDIHRLFNVNDGLATLVFSKEGELA